MLELRPSLKAIKGLAIPSISITIFLLFIVADLELVWSIITGSTYFSYIIRLTMLGVEIYLFRYFYLIEFKVIEKERQEGRNKELLDSLNNTKIDNKVKNLVTNLKSDYMGNYINELRSFNRVNVDYIEDSNSNKWYKFTSIT